MPPPWTVIWGSESLTLPLRASTPDAVAALQPLIRPIFRAKPWAAGLVGTVSHERIAVRFQRPWVHNGLAPCFVGRFGVVAGRPSLAGVFRLSRFTQLFLSIWFGGLLLLTLVMVPAAALGFAEPDARFGLLILLIMWSGGLGTLYFGRWMARRDRTEIEARLRQALGSIAA